MLPLFALRLEMVKNNVKLVASDLCRSTVSDIFHLKKATLMPLLFKKAFFKGKIYGNIGIFLQKAACLKRIGNPKEP